MKMTGFHEIIGQEHIKDHLINSIRNNKISHAYIISGETGSGKKMLANIFSMSLQCENEKGEKPCGSCTSCRQAMTRNQPDIIRIFHDKPNTISVDDIRMQLNNTIQIKPYRSRYKIYIIEEAEKLSIQAQNALLKTLEEPPGYTVILLLTNNEDILLPTIRSRCIMLKMKMVEDDLIKNLLMEKYQIPDYAASLSAAFARGNVGKAITLSVSADFYKIKDHVIHLLKYIKEMDVYEMIQGVKSARDFKVSIADYLDLILVWYRDVLLFKATSDVNTIIFKDEVNDIMRLAEVSSYEGIKQIQEALEKAKIRLHANVNFDLTMELLFLTIKEN